jgi:hypothetical protein
VASISSTQGSANSGSKKWFMLGPNQKGSGARSPLWKAQRTAQSTANGIFTGELVEAEQRRNHRVTAEGVDVAQRVGLDRIERNQAPAIVAIQLQACWPNAN